MTLTGTSHFSLAEVAQNTEWPIPDVYQGNAQLTLRSLEQYRAVLGVPLVLHSLWRSPAANAALPGSAPDSAHLQAKAADVVPLRMSIGDAARKLAAAQAAGQLPAFDQILVEPDHLHIAPFPGRNEALVGSPATGWTALSDWARSHPLSTGAATLGVVALAWFPVVAHAARPWIG